MNREAVRKQIEEGVKEFVMSSEGILQLLNYIETLEKDAARYKWLSRYLASDDISRDDELVAACACVEKLNSVIDTAIQGEMENGGNPCE